MIVFLNGQFVSSEQATISVFDRGFLHGDGLFETFRAYQGRPFLWKEHLTRLAQGAEALRLNLPDSAQELRVIVDELLHRNELRDAIIRITISRGIGPRGYSLRGAGPPTRVVTAQAAPPLDSGPSTAWKLHTATLRLLSDDPLGRHKTACKLAQVMARAEAEAAGADEALLLNSRGHVAEAAAGNVFWFDGPISRTPGLGEGCLAGVTRGFVMRLLHRLGCPCQESADGPEALQRAGGVFLTLSSLGVVEVGALDGRPLPVDRRTSQVQEAYREAIRGQLSD